MAYGIGRNIAFLVSKTSRFSLNSDSKTIFVNIINNSCYLINFIKEKSPITENKILNRKLMQIAINLKQPGVPGITFRLVTRLKHAAFCFEFQP